MFFQWSGGDTNHFFLLGQMLHREMHKKYIYEIFNHDFNRTEYIVAINISTQVIMEYIF